MKAASKLANKIEGGGFVVTAELKPAASADGSAIKSVVGAFNGSITAVNVSDNHFGVAASSLAGSVAVNECGSEAVYQVVTRDRNRIALQSDILGAACLGIGNILCLSGYHQTLTGCGESANVYDIDSIQLIEMVRNMRDDGALLDGSKIEGDFSMLIGAVANPYMTPLELNILRLGKKIEAGADFIQTQAVFDVDGFGQWLKAAGDEGLTDKTAILAGVQPLESASEAQRLRDTYTDVRIGDEVIERLRKAGDDAAQKKEGVAICGEIIGRIKGLAGLRGIHILSGGNESVVKDVIAAAGL